MSGRWRSRYWTADNGEAQQQQQRWHHRPDHVNPGGIIRAAGDQDVRGDKNRTGRHNCGEHDGRSNNGAGYDNHNGINDNEERCSYYGRESSQEQFVSHQLQRQQPEPHHAKRAWRPDERNEWQRGQSLPQTIRGSEPMESLGRNQGSRFIKRDSVPATRNSNSSGDGNHSRSVSVSSVSRTHHTGTTNNSVLSDSITLKTQVPTKKPFAWNAPQSSLQQAAAKRPSTSKQSLPSSTDPATSNLDVKAKKPFAWSKPDSIPSPTVAATIPSVSTSQLKIEPAFSAEISDSNSSKAKGLPKKQTAWGVVTKDLNRTKILHANEDKKPSLSKQSLAPNSTSAFPPLNERNMQTGSSFPSSTPLPFTSSWGKRHSNSASIASDKKKLPIASEEKQMVTVEKFPSLSTTVSTMSRRQQGSNNPPPPLRPSTTDKPNSKSTPKKGAPYTSLASFLPNQAVVAPGPRISASKKKGVASSSTVGNKRSAPSSATMAPMEHGTGGMIFSAEHMKKGPQRSLATSTPRKKKLTTLKKKVLKERLRVWKERNGIIDCDNIRSGAEEVALDDGENEAETEQPCLKRLKRDGRLPVEAGFKEKPQEVKSTTLLVENFIRPEDNLVDEDEYDEIVSGLIQLAGTVGNVVSVFVPRPQDVDEVMDSSGTSVTIDHVGLAFVRFATDNDASTANQILQGMVVGGQKICTSILNSMELAQFSIDSKSNMAAAPSEENTLLWRITVLRVVTETQLSMNVCNDAPSNNIPTENIPASSVTTIVIHKILSEDDFLDEEALHESIGDLKGLASVYGLVVGTRWETMGENKGNVYITYAQRSSADEARKQLSVLIVGGSKIIISLDVDSAHEQHHSMAGEVILSNVLNDDDLDDEDCLSESLNDIRNLAEKYGNIGHIKAEVSGEQRGSVIISYVDGHQVAQHAAQQLSGIVLGGRQLSATVSLTEISSNDSLSLKEESKCDTLPVMLSGGKRIPAQFAECKRVPKVPNAGTPRSYASKISDERAVPLLVEMLGELMRLQERSKDDKNARARRRLVMGLREVARGIRAHKVKMVVMANNLDEYGAIDSKLQEILDMATADELPILYELNKRKLGNALGKSIKVSVVGIQNADGAHDQFKKLKKMLGMA